MDKPVNVQHIKWIPVSERLPEEKQMAAHKESDLCIVTIRNKEDDRKFTDNDFTVGGQWVNYDIEDIYEVIAWMPYPEPYKEDDK